MKNLSILAHVWANAKTNNTPKNFYILIKENENISQVSMQIVDDNK